MNSSGDTQVCDACRTVPVSLLSLDAPEPIGGWEAFFAVRGVEITADDLGRPSIPRSVLGELLVEQSEREARLAEEWAQKAAADRTPVAVGVPAAEGLSAFETIAAQPGYQTIQDELGRPKPSFLDEQLAEGRREAAMRAEQEAVKHAQRVLEGRDEN